MEMCLGAVVGLVVDGAYVEVEFQGFEGFLHGSDDICRISRCFPLCLRPATSVGSICRAPLTARPWHPDYAVMSWLSPRPCRRR